MYIFTGAVIWDKARENPDSGTGLVIFMRLMEFVISSSALLVGGHERGRGRLNVVEIMVGGRRDSASASFFY